MVVDYAGTIEGEPFEGSERRDFPIELGSDGLLPEFETGLAGASAGEERTVEVTFPDDHRPEELAGKTASFALTVKEVREKDLPELDDAFASEASEFETLAELREALTERLSEGLGRQAEAEFQEAAVDAVAANAKLEVPHDLDPRPGARDVGADRAPARAPGESIRRPMPGCRARTATT